MPGGGSAAPLFSSAICPQERVALGNAPQSRAGGRETAGAAEGSCSSARIQARPPAEAGRRGRFTASADPSVTVPTG